MGHGLGPAQRAVLAALEDTADLWLSVPALATATSLAERRARAVVRTLEARGLVEVERGQVGWREGVGRLVLRGRFRPDYPATDEGPVALTLNEGDRWPYSRWTVASRDGVEFVRAGMPVFGLRVWLPARRAECLASRPSYSRITAAATGR